MWSYYFIMKNIYIFTERNVPELQAKLTQDIKKHFFTVRVRAETPGGTRRLGRAGGGSRPSILGGQAAVLLEERGEAGGSAIPSVPESHTNVHDNGNGT